MIKKVIAGLCLIFSAAGFSQQRSASPYSYYGIGDTSFKGTVENRAMGGLGIVGDSIHMNLQNPATYNALMLTTFTIGASSKNTSFKSDSGDDSASRTTIDYLAVAVPYKKFGFAFGLMPFTSVGYKIQNEQINPDDNILRFRQFEGNGGINRAFAGMSYKISDKLSLGADFQYNFGNTETKSIVGSRSAGIQYPTREINSTDYNGVSFNLGATYVGKIKKLDWLTSVTFSPESKLKSATARDVATIFSTNAGTEVIKEQLETISVTDDVTLSSRLTLGTGVGQARKWFAGIEYSTQSGNSFGSSFDNVTNAGFESAQRVSLGGYYIPNYMSFNSYLSRVTYRGGLRYEKTGLVVNGDSINDMGLTLGMGLPLGGPVGPSNLNFTLEFGRRGTTNANLIQENYINLMVSLSINDKWFIKRKYD